MVILLERKQSMIIGVVGLGLIGGSFCRAVKAKTRHQCLGLDQDFNVLEEALKIGAIDGILEVQELQNCDLVIVCLHPKQTISFLTEHAGDFKKGGIVIDTCGIKTAVVEAVEDPLRQNGVTFIGAHPMAGREFSGFFYSLPDLYEGASFIMTPSPDVDSEKLEVVRNLAKALGFSRIVLTDCQTHDETIAFTSQIAHVISNAYVKSPTLQNQSGFSAGSYQDLSRVAKLNEDMWTDLFLMNQQPLLFELNTVIEHLQEYRNALERQDAEGLRGLLRDGRILKENA